MSLGGEESIVPAGGNKSQGMDVSRLLKVGEPIGIFYGFVGDGTFSTTDDIKNSAQPKAKPGDIRFKDFSGSDGKPDNKSTIMTGNYRLCTTGFLRRFYEYILV